MSNSSKKISVALNVILLAAVIFLLYGNYNRGKKDTGGPGHTGVVKPGEPGGNGTCNLCGDYASVATNRGLPVDLLDSMTTLYKEDIPGVSVYKRASLEDAKCAWFDLETLKKFIYDIEKNSCAANCGEEIHRLGIRIYYARYPETGTAAQNNNSRFSDLFQLDNAYVDRHTLFMVPTYSINNGEPKDFNALDFDPKKPCQFADIPATGFTMALAPSSSALNHGGLCPPICPSNPDYARFLK